MEDKVVLQTENAIGLYAALAQYVDGEFIHISNEYMVPIEANEVEISTMASLSRGQYYPVIIPSEEDVNIIYKTTGYVNLTLT